MQQEFAKHGSLGCRQWCCDGAIVVGIRREAGHKLGESAKGQLDGLVYVALGFDEDLVCSGGGGGGLCLTDGSSVVPATWMSDCRMDGRCFTVADTNGAGQESRCESVAAFARLKGRQSVDGLHGPTNGLHSPETVMHSMKSMYALSRFARSRAAADPTGEPAAGMT